MSQEEVNKQQEEEKKEGEAAGVEQEQEMEEKPKEKKYYEYNGKSLRPNLINHDMTEDDIELAYELAFESLKKFGTEKVMAEYIKDEMDKRIEPEWQCVIGKDFSVAFSHEIENFVFFQIEDIYFLFYKL